jgi:MarR family 2-MHQ and catechol resistance regulon transcriptional repressor
MSLQEEPLRKENPQETEAAEKYAETCKEYLEVGLREDTSGVHLWLILMKAHQALAKYAIRSIEATGLCFSDFTALEALLHKGAMPINALGEKLALTSGALTAVVDRLEKKGYVERRFDAVDRRVRLVTLTGSGEERIRALFRRHSEDMEESASNLTLAEREGLIALLKKLGKDTASRLEE